MAQDLAFSWNTKPSPKNVAPSASSTLPIEPKSTSPAPKAPETTFSWNSTSAPSTEAPTAPQEGFHSLGDALEHQKEVPEGQNRFEQSQRELLGGSKALTSGFLEGAAGLVDAVGGNIMRWLEKKTFNRGEQYNALPKEWQKLSEGLKEKNKQAGVSEFTQALGEGVGAGIAKFPLYALGGEAVAATKIPALASGLLTKFPTVGRYLAPIVENTLQNTGAFELANQPFAEDHWKQFKTDLRDAGLFAFTGIIPKKILSIPATGLLSFGMAKLDGASNGDAVAAGVLNAGMHGVGVLGDKPAMTHEQALGMIRRESFSKINKFSESKIGEKSTPEEIRKAYHEAVKKTHPDRGGKASDFNGVKSAFDFLNAKPENLLRTEAKKQSEVKKEAITAPKNEQERIQKAVSEIPKTASEADRIKNAVQAVEKPVQTVQTEEGLATGRPQKSISSQVVPGTERSLPSSTRKTAVGTEGKSLRPNSTRYIEPSDFKNSSRIQDHITTLRETAQHNKPILEQEFMQKMGRKPDFRVKSVESLEGKINRKLYKKENPNDIHDVLAGRFIVPENEIGSVIDQVQKNFDIKEIEDYHATPSVWGYRGANIQIKLPGGGTAEVQVHTPQSLTAQSKIHKLYEKWRNKDLSKLTDAELTERAADIEKSRALSEGATISTAKGRKESAIKPVEVEGEAKKSSLYERMRESLNANDKAKALSEGIEYKEAKMREQEERAASFVEEHPDRALRIARGQELPPEGMLWNKIVSALEFKLREEGKIKEWNEVATAQTNRATRYGQEISALRGVYDVNKPEFWHSEALKAKMSKINGENPFKVIYEKATNKKARTTMSEKVEKQAENLKREVRSREMTIADADALLRKLVC